MQLHHITVASVGRLVLAGGPNEVRAVIRALARVCRDQLLVFSVVDDHLHLVVACDRPRLLVRELTRALRTLLPHVELQAAHVRPVESRKHLRSLVSYLLGQPRKHGLPVHPALWEGGCFLDLAGARLLPGFDPNALARALPRWRVGELFEDVELTGARSLVPATQRELADAGVARLFELAAAVLALPTPLTGRMPEVVAARALAVQMALWAGFRPGGILPFLGRSARALRRFAHYPLPGELHRALGLRLALELRARRGDAPPR